MEDSKKLSEILIIDKKDIIETLNDLVHYYGNIALSKKCEDDTFFFRTMTNELNKFIEEVEEAEFPPLLPPWAYSIDLRIDSFTVCIGKLELEDTFGIRLQLPIIYGDVLTPKTTHYSQGCWLYPKSSFITHTLKTLTAEEYALRNNLSPITIREYIRKGIIMGASKIGRQWYIPLLAKKRTNKQFCTDIGYDYVSTPKNLPLKYKYLDNENIKSLKITKYKKSVNAKRYTNAELSIYYKDDSESSQIQLSIIEAKELELFLQSTPSFKYNNQEYRMYVWDKLRTKEIKETAAEDCSMIIGDELFVLPITETP